MRTDQSCTTRSIDKQKQYTCITLGLFTDIEPIPECENLIDGKRFRTPGNVADEMLRECRIWQKNNPGKNVIDIIPPNWVKYIIQNL
nr:MAG TPA: hypothetical protein [Caudoviricetes sp.]